MYKDSKKVHRHFTCFCTKAKSRSLQQQVLYLQTLHSSSLYYFLFLGLAGNQPFSTLFFCWKTSPMLQKEENATTPKSIEIISSETNNDAMADSMPSKRKSHQLFTPM